MIGANYEPSTPDSATALLKARRLRSLASNFRADADIHEAMADDLERLAEMGKSRVAVTLANAFSVLTKQNVWWLDNTDGAYPFHAATITPRGETHHGHGTSADEAALAVLQKAGITETVS